MPAPNSVERMANARHLSIQLVFGNLDLELYGTILWQTSGDMVDFEHWQGGFQLVTVLSSAFFFVFSGTSAAAYLCIPNLMNDGFITVS